MSGEPAAAPDGARGPPAQRAWLTRAPVPARTRHNLCSAQLPQAPVFHFVLGSATRCCGTSRAHGPRAAGFANYQLLPLESTEGRDVSHHCSAVMLLSRRVGSGTPACATLFWPRLTRNVSHSNNVAPGRGTRPARPTGPRKLSPPSTPLDLASSRPSGRGLR